MLPDNSSKYFYTQTQGHYLDSNSNLSFFLEDPKIITILSKRGQNNTHNIVDVLRALEDFRNRLNISIGKECEHTDYCSGEFRELILGYNSIHGYVSLLICLFGSLANALNVAVLTRRDLAAAPINRLLKWLAVADVFVMLEYVPFAIYRYMVLPRQLERPYSWAVYMLFHMHFTQIFHSASIFLTLSLAIWRYVAIKRINNSERYKKKEQRLGGQCARSAGERRNKEEMSNWPPSESVNDSSYSTECARSGVIYPAHSPALCTDNSCTIAILLSFMLPPILCIPSYAVFTIHKDFNFDVDLRRTSTKVYFVDSDYDGKFYQINFWVHAVLIKLLPCLILTMISAWLIRALYTANSRKRALKGYNACPKDAVVNSNGNVFTRKSTKRSKAERRTDRTTKMLVAVLLLFLLTEFPQGILGEL
ncbi:hypothetical protein EVAR_4697_1 [Eumeta japonica]|uniref:G-protein coupled receptors family 1 profile domain-containing protein n=1 Tax=Eumeta variegata TaxID=151549 RepID=A0A4C1WQM0_EUMVA|nr:hypothetical protein EVAR_4697_1 [Eumeta japonica]